jgi:8-oxo-dGTP pyrophosphatase MutT (NUDIX family)
LDHALLQQRAVIQKAADVGPVNATYHGSGCAQRLGGGSARPAACVVVKDNKALLVYVPYGGERRGWDLPGGWHKGDESPCETAEREVCEETGMSVKAVARLSGSVFRCEITGRNVCTKPVDEGFLKKGFFRKRDLVGLKFRAGSWGNKVGYLREALSEDNRGPSIDACGCRPGIDGWSTTTEECKATSRTSPEEAIGCQRRRKSAEFDVCGCKLGEQGWSSTRRRCSTTSETSQSEADRCRRMSLQIATED